MTECAASFPSHASQDLSATTVLELAIVGGDFGVDSLVPPFAATAPICQR